MVPQASCSPRASGPQQCETCSRRKGHERGVRGHGPHQGVINYRRQVPRRLVSSAVAALLTLGALTVLPAPAAQAADSNCPSAAGSYAGGSGTAGDPFLISTPAQLQRLRDRSTDWSKVVRLTADIDMSSGGTESGAMVTPWSKRIGGTLQQGLPVLVASDGTFTWSRRVAARKPWSVFVTAAGARSNVVVLP